MVVGKCLIFLITDKGHSILLLTCEKRACELIVVYKVGALYKLFPPYRKFFRLFFYLLAGSFDFKIVGDYL